MRDLNYALKQLCRRNRDGSYATQADREHMLDQIADQLEQMGFRQMDAHSLKPKHVEKLVERWLAEGRRAGHDQEPHERAALVGGEGRQGERRRANQCRLRHSGSGVRHQRAKAKELDADQLSAIRDVYIRMSLRLQAAFGLRREESIKIVLAWADRGDGSCSRPPGARGVGSAGFPSGPWNSGSSLDEAKALAKGKSLVAPGYATYRDYLRHFRYRMRAGRHPWRPRSSAFLCAGALPGTDRLDVPGARRPEVQAAHQETEAARSRSSSADQPRDGPRPRGDYGRLSRTLNVYVKMTRFAPTDRARCSGSLADAFAVRGCRPSAHASGGSTAPGEMRRDSGSQAWPLLDIHRGRPCRVRAFVLRYASASVASDSEKGDAMSLRKRGGIWWVDVVAPNGERVRRTTGTANKALAQEFHDRLKSELWRIAKLGEKPRRTWNEAVVRWVKEKSHKARSREMSTCFVGSTLPRRQRAHHHHPRHDRHAYGREARAGLQ